MNENEINKAELIQGLKAFLIPSSLFVACLLGAAGTFLIREGYQLGWGFILASAVIIISAFAAFITFQNKLRVKGQMVDPFDIPAPDYDALQDHEVKIETPPAERAVERQEAIH